MGLGANILGRNCYDDNGLVNDWKYFMKPLISEVPSVSQCKIKCQERKNCKGFTYDKIGEIFKCKHETVMHNEKIVSNIVETNRSYRELFNQIEVKVQMLLGVDDEDIIKKEINYFKRQLTKAELRLENYRINIKKEAERLEVEFEIVS